MKKKTTIKISKFGAMIRLNFPKTILAALALFVVLSTAQAAPVDNVQDREMERAASRLYDGAMDFYKAEAYWKAARELITILDFYPAYSKIDGVLMHLGESLYNMRMYDSASRMFRYLATKYPNSPHLLEALHGLQRVNYQSGDLIESLKIYNGFAARFASEETIDSAHYFGGMAYFQMQNYDSTVAALARISIRSRYYDYGLYTSGLALLKKKSINESVETFRKLLKLPLIQPSRYQLMTETRLTLGYIYYELNYYHEAISHFRQITADQTDYPQSLLAASWAAFKLKDYQAAITTLNTLIGAFEGTEYSEEAHFLLGQAYLELGLFDSATAEYDFIIQNYPESNGVADRVDEINTRLLQQEAAVEKLRINLLLLESKLNDIIPLQADGQVPKYIEEERRRLNTKREALFENIVVERGSFERFNAAIQAMRRMLERVESRRNWRAYAEYGKTRAFFMKGLSGIAR